jgi:hypothetical protein
MFARRDVVAFYFKPSEIVEDLVTARQLPAFPETAKGEATAWRSVRAGHRSVGLSEAHGKD